MGASKNFGNADENITKNLNRGIYFIRVPTVNGMIGWVILIRMTTISLVLVKNGLLILSYLV